MSFLVQTDEDYIKIQMRSLLTNPRHKKQLKKNLRKIGLYNRKIGFSTYKYFIDAELQKKRSKSTNSNYQFSFASNKHKGLTPLPKISPILEKKPSSIIQCNFFARGKIAISCCVLFKLVSKINVIPPVDDSFRGFLMQRMKDSEVKMEFAGYYLGVFCLVVKNSSNVLGEGLIQLTGDLEKEVNGAYTEVNRVATLGKKGKISIKDYRFLAFLDTKPWIRTISESLNRFYFKKFTVLGERNFNYFIANYLLTNNLQNMLRLCFEVYDKKNSQFINSSDLFVLFESPMFPLIKSDLFVMINYLSNYKYSINTSALKRKPSLYFQELAEKENRKIDFKTFSKLKFEQKFPNMLLVVIHAIFGQTAVNQMCIYYNIHKYKVTIQPALSLFRPINYCRDYYKVVCSQYKILKADTYGPYPESFTKELIKGALVSFLILCDSENLCENKIQLITLSSITKSSETFLGKKTPELMRRIFSKAKWADSGQISLSDFLEYIQGYFDVETVHQRAFGIYDVNDDGTVSVLELISLLSSGESVISKPFDEELQKFSEIMENKRLVTVQGGGFIDLQDYSSLVPVPALKSFLAERLLYLLSHKKKVFKEVHMRLNEEYNN